MRRISAVGAALFVTLVLGGVGAAEAQTSTSSSTSTTTSTVITDPAVTVEGGPAQSRIFVPPCNDIAVSFQEQLSFVVRAIPPAPLTLTYRLSGSAQAGVNYEPLPGTVTIPAGSASATVTVVPKQTPTGAIVDLTLEVTGGTPLAPPAPPKATIRFLSPPPPGPYECGYRFTADARNTAQTVAVGGALRALTLEQVAPPLVVPATGVFLLLSGGLPPGVELRADGSFGGTPTLPGVFTARIEACRAAPPGTCVTTDLTVTVTGTRVLPRTGSALSVGDWVLLAVLVIGAGLAAMALAAPHRRPPAPPMRRGR